MISSIREGRTEVRGRRRSPLLRLATLLLGLGMAWAASAEAPVRVFAAASLKDAMDEVAAAWADASGQRALVTYAATSTLARQIEQGAPVDLFVSANQRWMDYVAERKRVRADSIRPLLRNALVLVAPADSATALEIAPGFDLLGALGGGRLAICNPAVPAGSYGRQALQSLGVWDALRTHVVLAENVRAALRLVSRGEMPLGVVYASDAVADPQVRVVDVFPQDSHEAIVYPAALIDGSRHPQARALLDYLGGASAQAVFERWGFAPAAAR
ncbi:MAG: molybdate ABC transporter substrate-binding protein [Nevskiales bacterium]|nr:molybdate ABC transporter substrate-binding protein [Nevskiales bacterium]